MVKHPKRPRDPAQLAKLIVDIATGDAEDKAPTQDRRAEGGRVGGKKRAEKLSADERKRIAEKAAEARWADKR